MKLGTTLYVTNRRAWRTWLARNHVTAKEIWLIFHTKDSGKPRIRYNDAVEEALCYGWIDSIVKKVDRDSFAQRFSPRKPTSRWSEMNKERVRRLIKQGKMTRAGMRAAQGALGGEKGSARGATLEIPHDILKQLKSDDQVWRNFQRFPKSYQRIRIGWIDAARKRPAEFEKRLRYFLKMTAENKRFGMVQ